MNRTIIEVALSGPTKARNPNAPVAPEEVTRDILACLEAGAAVAHNHLDDFRHAGQAAAQRYGAIWKPVLERRPDAILIPTLGGVIPGDPLGAYGHILHTAGVGARLGPFDPGSVNLTAGSPDGQPNPQMSAAYVSDYATLDRTLAAFADQRIPASISVFDPSFLRATMAYERAGRFLAGSFLKLFFGGPRSYLDGAPGVSFGLPPTVAALDVYLSMMEGSRLPWAAAVLGGDILGETAFAEAVVARGGHLRVGLEDYAGDETPANAELAARAAAFVARLGRPPASIADAEQILGLAPVAA